MDNPITMPMYNRMRELIEECIKVEATMEDGIEKLILTTQLQGAIRDIVKKIVSIEIGGKR